MDSASNLFLGSHFPRFFLQHVLSIFFVTTKPKMGWIYAQRGIASMAHTHSFWNTSFMNHVRGTMRKIRFSLVFNLSIFPIVLSGVKNAPVIAMMLSLIQSLPQRFKQWRDTRTERFGYAFAAAKFGAIQICRAGCSCKQAAAMNASHGSCRHISLYRHGGLNGQAERLALYTAAKEVLA